MLLNYIHWSVNPEIFPDVLPVRWYGLLFAAAFFFGYIILMRIFKHEKLPVNLLDQLATYVFIATIIGARLGHVFFYEPEHFLADPVSILKIWQGGLASHGAAIGILFAIWLFSRKNKKSFFWVLDRLVIVVALGGFFIRMGNLMNSEIYGEVTTVPWAFVFTSQDEFPRHPTQIYEGLSYLLIFAYLLWYYWKNNGKPKEGFIFGMFLILLFVVRFLIEFVKEPQVAFETNMTLNMGQWLSIPFILAGFYIVLRKPRK
ncbi:MAG: prolipoprotein diacylglyceryl transferase [Sphingobacteriia bacterium]|nr:prolipoprotein diacylglyceryl transferase [Sphingobacteriia bacterium]